MMYVVCRNRNDNSLFITTRMARETMISVLNGIGEVPDSNVLKECPTYEEADKFKRDQELTDKQLDNILKP
jgi:hypothetical protein